MGKFVELSSNATIKTSELLFESNSKDEEPEKQREKDGDA